MKKLFILAILTIPLMACETSGQSIPFPGPGNVPPPIGSPQSLGTINSVTNATTYTFTTGANIVKGDLLEIAVINDTVAGNTISSISDGTNSYTRANRLVSTGGSVTWEIWYVCGAAAVSSGATTTITVGATGTLVEMAIATRTSGIVPVSCLDVAPAGLAQASGTSISTATGALAKTNELVFAQLGINNSPAITEGAGFTRIGSVLVNANGFSQDAASQKVSSTSSVTYAPSWAATELNGALVAAFKGF